MGNGDDRGARVTSVLVISGPLVIVMSVLATPGFTAEHSWYSRRPYVYAGIGRTTYDNLASGDTRLDPVFSVGYAFLARPTLDVEIELAPGRDRHTLAEGTRSESTFARSYLLQTALLNLGGLGRRVGGFAGAGVGRLSLGEATETFARTGNQRTLEGGSAWGVALAAGARIVIRPHILLRIDLRWVGSIKEPDCPCGKLEGESLALRYTTVALEYHF